MATRINQDGQPVVSAFCARMVTDRQIDELIGLCKGVIADGALNQQEAEFICEWLKTNREAAKRWPGDVIYDRVARALEDGKLSAEEEAELVPLLLDFTGGRNIDPDAASMSTTLPLDSSPPTIRFDGRLFCLTGKFMYGCRTECAIAVVDRGGDIKAAPTQRTDYLVVGDIGSRDWVHSTYGRKIEKAVELREAGHPIAIVSEQHWVKHLGR